MQTQSRATLPTLLTAVLALYASAAGAQGVTIYGKLDMSVSHMNAGEGRTFGGGNGAAGWSIKSGSDGILGFRGKEDLGNGYVARFQLEQRFNAESGTFRSTATTQSPAPAWWGESSVGLETPYGSIDLGRMTPPPGPVAFLADPFRWDTVGQISGYVAPNAFGANDILKYNNGVLYRSPRFGGGFSVALGVAASNGNARGKGYGMNVVYANGPMWAGFGYDARETATVKDHIAIATFIYDLGPIKPILSVSETEVAGVRKGFYSIGATAPWANGEVKAVYAVAHPRLFPTALAPKTTKVALGYHYPLSKRTKLYTDIASAKTEGALRATGYDVGVQVSF